MLLNSDEFWKREQCDGNVHYMILICFVEHEDKII